ncbi:hypothetical protein HEK616_80330 (plasmid) [Streptomyces nigrescens]|uniref:Uncharacterized protein n=1 Tax=Streptomyces nigrescens TaxID=1920 RepID=A0ABM8A7F1_STRNI|nr:hypothetical protein HEK616_80330 [Streptomyces nigrescens]
MEGPGQVQAHAVTGPHAQGRQSGRDPVGTGLGLSEGQGGIAVERGDAVPIRPCLGGEQIVQKRHGETTDLRQSREVCKGLRCTRKGGGTGVSILCHRHV